MDKQSIKNITERVLLYKNWNAPWEFEAYVIQSKLNEEEIALFKEIWFAATQFENWNHKDLSFGAKATTNLLTQNFGLEEAVATKIANAASYQWK